MKLPGSLWRRLLNGLLFVVRVGLGCLFIYSSLPKIRQPYDFLSNVYEYEIVGPKLGLLVAMVLPWLELLAGICLVGGIFVSGALLVSAGMAAMFTFVIASALYRGLQISCGCFGVHGDVINYSTLVRACLILFFSSAGCIGTVAFGPSPAGGEMKVAEPVFRPKDSRRPESFFPRRGEDSVPAQ